MTEARLVTLLRALVETRVHLDGPTGRFGECQHHLEALNAANAYLALPAAAPAEKRPGKACTCDSDPAYCFAHPPAAAPAEGLRDIADLVKRHTHWEAHVLIYNLRGPELGCLLCRALVAANVLTLDQIGSDTRAALARHESGSE